MTHIKTTKEALNFRVLPNHKSCKSCNHITCGTDQGAFGCKKLGFKCQYWDGRRYVCDAYEPKHVPTAREIALCKLTPEDKKALGLI